MEKTDLTYNESVTNHLPLFSTTIAAGFPSAADDAIEQYLDLNELIVKNSASTFFVRVEGTSMEGANIHTGDILVVDRSLSPSHGKIVVAIINGEFTVKRLVMKDSKIFLSPENPMYSSFEIHPESQFQVWGVVTYVIHKAI